MLCCTVLFTCHGLWSHKAILMDDSCSVPRMKGTSPRMAFSRVDLPQPTGPTIMVTLPLGMLMLISCRTPDDTSWSHPKVPSSIMTACETVELLPLMIEEKISNWGVSKSFSEPHPRWSSIGVPRLPRDRHGILRRSGTGSTDTYSWILLKEPIALISDESAIMREPSGSERSVKSESDVNTFAVSSVLVLLPFCARTENTAKARTGDAIGEM